ncbi:MAG TPA: hypothetical protein VHX14_06510 [Thermoanaerobaculia bacterium]|jgi:hypothetical protein|nr:hypothetical protein [Thermoanaerobaculia bacterium]
MATTKGSPDRFIGISIEDFFEQTDAQTKAGRYSDGTEMKPVVRDALQNFSKSLRGQQLRISSYVFAFSRHVVIFIDF